VTQPNVLIWDYIKDLLLQHDCVIVPGFGGFVCNREPAKIDQVSHIITPPSRKVVFNQNLKTNDGLLAEFWSQKQNVTYSQALLVIEECITSIVNTLQEKKQLSIDLFGSFRLNAEANYVFLPDKRNNYLISSYGLNAIQAQPVTSRVMKILPKAKTNQSRLGKPARKTTKRLDILKPLLTVVIVGLLTVNGYIFLNDQHPIGSNSSTMSIGSWFDSLFHDTTSGRMIAEPTAAKATEEPEDYIPAPPAIVEAEPIVLKMDSTVAKPIESIDQYASYYAFATHYAEARQQLFFPRPPQSDPIEDALVEEAPTIEPTSTKHTEVMTPETEKGYYVIGGMFCKERNALRFLKRLTDKGYNEAQLLPSKDQHCKRVSYKKFTSKAQAENYCLQIKVETNPDAWVLAIH
jgi:nucleoid DNA-binding protein